MQQVLHILKKDIRCFVGEIALFLAACGIVLWNETRFTLQGLRPPQMYSILPLAVGVYLISRLIHAEAIPGDRWFWLTRPYHWKSLLAEKLLFLFLFVNLPLTITVFVVSKVSGFSTAAVLPSLLLWQVFTFVALVLPVAALAAVTESLASFIGGAVLLVAAQISLMQLVVAPQSLGLSWVSDLISGGVIVAGAVAILYWQYKVRHTMQSRVLLGVVIGLSIVAAALVPVTSALDLNARFFPGRVDPSTLKVTVVPGSTRELPGAVTMVLEVQGIPSDLETQAQWFVGQFIDSDGNTRPFPARNGWVPLSTERGLKIKATVDLFNAGELHGKPVTLRGRIYVTLFGDPRSWASAPDQGFELPETVCSGKRWFFGGSLYCSTLFDRRPGILYVTLPGRRKVRVFSSYRESYSPLPRLTLDLIKREEVDFQTRGAVELTFLKPVSHFWLEFELPVARFLEGQ